MVVVDSTPVCAITRCWMCVSGDICEGVNQVLSSYVYHQVEVHEKIGTKDGL